MKKRPQSEIDDARRHAKERLARLRELLTNDDVAKKLALKEMMYYAEVACEQPETLKDITERLDLAQAQGLLKICGDDGFTGHDELLAIVAVALEHGKLPPKPLCEYVAKVLRQVVEENHRNTPRYRDLTIVYLLADFQGIIPLFPNPATLDKIERGILPEQTYACDIVIGMLEEIDIRVSRKTAEQVWYQWFSRYHRRFPHDDSDKDLFHFLPPPHLFPADT